MFESLRTGVDKMESIAANMGMGTFQKAVLAFFLILLIIILVVLAIKLTFNKSSKQWPPIVSNCPDFWLDKPPENGDLSTYVSGSNCTGISGQNTGTANPLTMDFTSSNFKGVLGSCNKYTWANKNKVSWDGITYGVNNPCNSN